MMVSYIIKDGLWILGNGIVETGKTCIYLEVDINICREEIGSNSQRKSRQENMKIIMNKGLT